MVLQKLDILHKIDFCPCNLRSKYIYCTCNFQDVISYMLIKWCCLCVFYYKWKCRVTQFFEKILIGFKTSFKETRWKTVCDASLDGLEIWKKKDFQIRLKSQTLYTYLLSVMFNVPVSLQHTLATEEKPARVGTGRKPVKGGWPASRPQGHKPGLRAASCSQPAFSSPHCMTWRLQNGFYTFE